MKHIFTIFLAVILLISCGDETIEVDGTVSGKEYFPIEEGREWVYSSDSIVYDENVGIIDTLTGFIRERITKVEGDAFVIERSFKKNEDDTWEISDIWSGRLENTRAIRTEENLSFIKLIFPPALNKSWDGNALFDQNVEIVIAGEPLRPYQGWDYQITAVDGTYNNEMISTDDVIDVLQVDEESFIDRRYSLERFARDIGMVEKRLMLLECQCTGIPETIPWEEKAEKGVILTQRLISYQ